MNWEIQPFDVLSSTQTELKAKASTAPEGTVVWARQQTQGYGRKKDPWQSPLGGLYFSFLLKPETLMPHLPQVVLLSLADTLRFLADIQLVIKWPNDIWGDTGKLSGFLIDSQVLGRHPRYYVCGVGMNINQEQMLSPAVSLRSYTGQTYHIRSCLEQFLAVFQVHYLQALQGSAVFDAYFNQVLRRLELALPSQNESIEESIYV